MFKELKDHEICEYLIWMNKDNNRVKLKHIFKDALEELAMRLPLVAKVYSLKD